MVEFQVGQVLGHRFEIVGVLGRGGAATVFLAHDRVRGAQVALKVLHGHLALSASWRSRLRREVSAAARLRHPRALVASDLHDLGGALAVSMPVHPGRTLADHVMARGLLSGPDLERLARQLAEALQAAHAVGLVHRDVTPTNVLVDDAGDAVLTDFGLARFTDQRTATGTGALGTPGYAAPEVYRGVRGDPRSDLYGLGAVLHLAATGRAPFAEGGAVESLRRQLAGDRIALSRARPDLPEGLTRLVDRLLAPDPEARPQGAAELLDALDERPAAVPRALPARPDGALNLPRGLWSVIVAERRDDQGRRRALRWAERQRRPVRGAELPEHRLIDAVAAESGLPAGSVPVPRVVLARRFCLVDGVSATVARRLVQVARAEGFEASLRSVGGPSDTDDSAFTRGALFALFVSVGLLVAAVYLPPVMVYATAPGIVVFGIVGAALAALAPWRSEVVDTRDHLPTAFPHEPERRALPVVRPAAQPAGPSASVADRTRAQLQALRDALPGARIPDAAGTELAATVDQLAQRAEALGRQVAALDRTLASIEDAAAATASDRVEQRLERCRTLVRAGQSHAAHEIPDLERALAAHQAVLERAEVLEAQLTLAVARLLETGAAAAHARLELIEAPDPEWSVGDLLERLRGQADDARRALAELEPGPSQRVSASVVVSAH